MKAENIERAGREILDSLAGLCPEDAFAALATALASAAGCEGQYNGTEDIHKDVAHMFVDAVAEDAHGIVDRYWGKFIMVKKH